MDVSTRKILAYTLLPGILPRIGQIFRSGFGFLSLSIAYIFLAVRLLPSDHPYLNPKNFGRFGVRHVIFEARRHLVFDRHHIDQIVAFFAILAGMVILALQFFLIISAALIPMAYAVGGPAYLASFFQTPDPTYDLAFRMMDLTFGLNNGPGDPMTIFNSCIAQGVQCNIVFTPGGGGAFVPTGPVFTIPTNFHNGLHMLFHYYNIGIFIIALAIFMYMILAIVGETAQSGTPFGRRFNKAWAPIRLFVALGLLVPLTYGLNGAQLLTLSIAKFGSSMATNGWDGFVNDLAGTTALGDPARLVSTPNTPSLTRLIEFMTVVHACKYFEQYVNNRTIDAYILAPDGSGTMPFAGSDFTTAVGFTNNQDVTVRFGIEDAARYTEYSANVHPTCGEITLRPQDIEQPGAFEIQEGYYEILNDMWGPGLVDYWANQIVLRQIPTDARDPTSTIPTQDNLAILLDTYDTQMDTHIADAVAAQVASAEWLDHFRPLGWMGAAIWYNKVAELNGSLYSSAFAVPLPTSYTAVMEFVLQEKMAQNEGVGGEERYNPRLKNGQMIEFRNDRDRDAAITHYYAQSFWFDAYEEPTGNVFTDTIKSIFGLEGLLSIRDNVDIHPLAQLVGVGRSLIEAATTNLGFALAGGLFGGISNFLGAKAIGSVALSAASFAGQIAMITLSIGFILYYILPFLPFIYFFFAATAWVKGIFEAMVGLPLWAAAHIRIDGEGLPGPVAMNGYFLIMDIFVRPLFIVFGLIAGITIFAAQVQVLNEIWNLVVTNIVGADLANTTPLAGGLGVGVGDLLGDTANLRGAADQLFYTCIYTIIVYMMGMASFKLIDLIPNNILRWMGSSVSTFSEQVGDPAGKLVGYAFMGTRLATGPINSGINGLAQRAMAPS